MIEDYCLDPRLAKIRIVLVETSHPGNIGGVARAMKNMGLSQLVLVNPRSYPSQEASSRASSATDVLAAAKVVPTLEEALHGVQLVFGASARLRKVSWPQLDVRQTAELALKTVQAEDAAPVAIVFGREDSGLSNSEMDLCNYLSHIPSNPTYSSLNISAAVQVFSYECLMATEIESVKRNGYRHQLATNDQLEGFYDHLFVALQDIGFLDPAKNARFMRRMRRLFNRAELDVKEVDILRGILSATQRKLGDEPKK
ncbi:RNA methyltransferase [Thiomicrorhabdus xiamenensis]|uniref:tRNA (cytidine/uridine-2'-O-)-methyltransferase TrmJ n=1 Tax=Thiomicrorhabdus xiamenensis TaxID=2739063 RepID=A0A7D4SZT5_9GAMM|nr:RNA methyltransferase [Thiomicrorhabdus xiamenensis]QKI88762.1 RNA methyltransferase [Thiomicrorhabdus xiamenensis]